jgi:hypothetical protein
MCGRFFVNCDFFVVKVLFGGSIFVEIVTHVMLAHMCKTPIMCAERYVSSMIMYFHCTLHGNSLVIVFL